MTSIKVIHPRVIQEDQLQQLAHIRAEAMQTVFKLCSGELKFRMSVPVQPGDTDIVLIHALDGMERMMQEVYRIRGEIKVMLAEEYDMPDEYRVKLMAIIFDGESTGSYTGKVTISAETKARLIAEHGLTEDDFKST